MDERFGKTYKLCSKKSIELLFKQGKVVRNHPLTLRYTTIENTLPAPFQIGISVPKRIFKHAVDRNRVKRLIREAVRKNKHMVEKNISQHNHHLLFFVVFTGQELPDYKLIEKSVTHLFGKLIRQLNND